MKEHLENLWRKIVENKAVLIKVGATVAGAALGALVATVVERSQEQNDLIEEIIMGIEEETE